MSRVHQRCTGCGLSFSLSRHRVRQLEREGRQPSLCGDCRHLVPRKEQTAEELVSNWRYWLQRSGLSEPEVVKLARDFVAAG